MFGASEGANLEGEKNKAKSSAKTFFVEEKIKVLETVIL
jgi:hypothetical protein